MKINSTPTQTSIWTWIWINLAKSAVTWVVAKYRALMLQMWLWCCRCGSDIANISDCTVQTHQHTNQLESLSHSQTSQINVVCFPFDQTAQTGMEWGRAALPGPWCVLGTGRCSKHLQSGCQQKQEGTDSQLGYSERDKQNNECLHGEVLLHDNSV